MNLHECIRTYGKCMNFNNNSGIKFQLNNLTINSFIKHKNCYGHVVIKYHSNPKLHQWQDPTHPSVLSYFDGFDRQLRELFPWASYQNL